MEPATTIISRFGGALKLASLLGVHETTVRRWTYPREARGTAGVIPHWYHARLLALAREQGVDLRPEEFIITPERRAS